MYWPESKVQRASKISKARFKFKTGDLVRISALKSMFTREINHKWSTEIFKTNSRTRHNGIPVYKLKDFLEDEIKGTFYQSELQKVSISEDKL